MTNNRNSGIDFLAGFLLLNIIYNHCCSLSGHQGFNLTWISFYMPWFFYKGGVFFKSKETETLISISWLRLIKPYIVYSIVGLVVYMVSNFLMVENVSLLDILVSEFKAFVLNGAFFANLPLWFLPALFASRIVTNFVLGKHSPLIYVFAIYIATLILHYALKSLLHHVPFCLFTVFTGSLYFAIGYLFRDIQYKKNIVIVAGCLYCIMLFTGIPQVDMRTDDTIVGSYLLWFPFSLSGCILYNNIVRLIPKKIADTRFNIISNVGRNSMIYYVAHWPLLLFATTFCNYVLHLSIEFSFYISLFFTFIFLFLTKLIFNNTWKK